MGRFCLWITPKPSSPERLEDLLFGELLLEFDACAFRVGPDDACLVPMPVEVQHHLVAGAGGGTATLART